MNTHPIDPMKPRTGFVVIVSKSVGEIIVYARDHAEVEEIVTRAQGQRSTRGVEVKAVDDVQSGA